MLYYIQIEYVVGLDERKTNDGIFNLWLILPYVTEIILNCVIFYYNFVKEKFGSSSSQQIEDDSENEPVVIVPTQMPPEIPTIASSTTVGFGKFGYGAGG